MVDGTLTIGPRAHTPRSDGVALHERATPPRLRALHVINGEHYAGAERVQDLLAQRLPEIGVDLGFACLKPGRFPALRQARNAPLIELSMRSRIDLRPAVRLARMVRSEAYDLLHTHSARALLIGRLAAALCGVPIVHHVHGNTSSEVAGRRFTRLNAWSERRALPAAQAVIAVSQSVGEYMLAAGVKSERLHVVPNGVPSRATLSSKTTSPAPATLGFIAWLRPRKGLETFLDAAAILKSQDKAVRLRIVGPFETTEYEQEIRDRADALGLADLIEWRGFQERVDLELDQMDLLVFPSVLPEGMPMVLLEAMAAGVPIVASRVSGITDVIRDKEDGLLFSAGNPAELAAAVTKVIELPQLASGLREAAFVRQRERFSEHSMTAAVAEIYQHVLTPKGIAT